MRSRTDNRSGKTAPALLEKHFREIVVGSGRSQEPYIIAFHYASDNVAGSALGTLFGFFEVEIHDQDAAYIVNVLASFAKKEYFANPRRSPVESFEAALHKINVALAEIVKDGNVSWLGHLHGALGAVSQNTLNFSVTGEGEIYLAREEALRSISEGLADTESEPHPLKTFTEVSSGELFDGDLIFALSPSVWSLFSPEDLRRSLNRLGPAGFEQFLRTALVNELPIAAVALITCSAPVELKRPEKTKSVTAVKPTPSLDNVWSEVPFNAARETKQSVKAAIDTSPVPEKREEYTDKKTGHIYVQASPDETFEPIENPWQERWTLLRHEFETKTRAWSIALRKISRRVGKESALAVGALWSRFSLLRRSLARKARTTRRTVESRWQTFREERTRRKALGETTDPTPSTDRLAEPRPLVSTDTIPASPVAPPAASTTPAAREKNLTDLTTMKESVFQITSGILPVIERVRTKSADGLRLLSHQSARSLSWASGFWQSLSPKEKWSVIGVASTVLAVGIIATIRTEDEVPVAQNAPTAPTEDRAVPIFPPAEEPLATLLSGSRLLFPVHNSPSIALASINGTTFLVTGRSIINLGTQESTPTPETLRLATGMDDLDAIFVIGESGSLYLWSAVTKKFERNSLPLPADTKIDALGSYLTYLYVLDQKAGTIYRFPRAEGGFGSGVTWSKEPVVSGKPTAFAVYENILLADASGRPVLYARGRNTATSFTGPLAPVSIHALAFDTRSGDIIALDRESKRIIRWSATGTLIGQYYHESFEEVEAIAISPDGSEVLVSVNGATTAWRIQ